MHEELCRLALFDNDNIIITIRDFYWKMYLYWWFIIMITVLILFLPMM
jgi:hypothetical protein